MACERRVGNGLRDHDRAPPRRGRARRLADRPRRGLPDDEHRARGRRGRPARAGRLRGRPAGVRAGRMSVVVAGVAESDLGVVGPGMTPGDLMAQASYRALEDAGLAVEDVDGLFATSSQLPMATLNLGEELRIVPRWTDATNVGGSSFLVHVQHARAALEAGLCSVALIAYGSTQRSVGRSRASVQEISPWEAPYRPWMPVTGYALAASRHMHEFGTTREQLAEVAVAARAWASLNPVAWAREPLTVDDVLAAPMVCDPLGVRDCCLVTDGGGAVVMVRKPDAPAGGAVSVLGCGVSHTHRQISEMPSLVETPAVASGAAAFAEAGLGPDDVDVLELYDAFTITPILFLEDLGFCPKGDGGDFVSEGRIAPGGSLPVNTNGGGLSYCHPGMYGIFLLIEAVRPLRGECGERQVPGARVALAHGNGGALSSQATVILGV